MNHSAHQQGYSPYNNPRQNYNNPQQNYNNVYQMDPYQRRVVDNQNRNYIQNLRNQSENLFSNHNEYLNPNLPPAPHNNYNPFYPDEITQNIHRRNQSARQPVQRSYENYNMPTSKYHPHYNSTNNFKSNNAFDMNKMMQMMMLMNMSNNDSSNSKKQKVTPVSRVEQETRDRVRQLTSKQSKMLEELSGFKRTNNISSVANNPLKVKLDKMQKKLESISNTRQEKENTTKPMPKFMMFMQQNLMNQMLIAGQQMNEQPLKSYPNIIPVPVDANQRILPISNNP